MSTYQELQEQITKRREELAAQNPEVEQREEEPEQEGMTLIETLSTDQNFKTINSYMSDRFGMEEDKYSKREIIDSYINQMRGFNAGQSVITVSELAHLNSGEGDKLASRRRTAAEAYELFDSLGGAFSEGRTFGEKADAVKDYARALLIDPLNLVTLGVGKIFTQAAAKTATQGVKMLAFRAGRQAAYQALKKGSSKKAAEQIQREATQKAFQEALKRSKTKAILNKADKKGIYASLGFDMAAAGGIDALQQKAEVTSGFKEEIDWFQTGISTATGALGGGLQLGLVAIKNKKNIPLASIQLHRSRLIQEATDESIKSLSKEQRKEVLASENVTEALLELKKKTQSWATKVAEGKKLLKVGDNPKSSIDYDTEFAQMFFIGNKTAQLEDGAVSGFKGLVSIIGEAGYKQSNDMNFTDFMGEAFGDLSEENRKIVVDAYEVLRETSDQLKPFNFEEFIKIDAASVSEAARIMQVKSQAQQMFNKIGLSATETDAATVAKVLLDPADEETVKGIFSKFRPLQDNLIRSIVTHPGTTALNLVGWQAATVNQSLSDLVRSALYSGAAAGSLITFNKTNATKYFKMSRQMMDLQRQKVRNMVDPYGTKDSVMDYLAVRPEAQKEMFRYINGGVEIKGILDEFELNPNAVPNKTNFQKYNEFFETLYAVKAQDFITKTQEFSYALDKQMRLKYDKTLSEFLNDPELVQYLSEPGTKRFKEFAEIEAAAVEDALRNTFSKKFGDNKSFVGQAAGMIEGLRTIPGVGALAPFGQFWNNSVAFMLDHSGISLINKYTVKAGGARAVSRDSMDLLTKSAVGWGAVGIGVYKQLDNLEQGLAWYEDRDDFGAVRSSLYDYPRNVPMLVGRMGAHLVRDGKIPSDLLVAFGDNFGTRALTRDLGDAYGAVTEGFVMAANADDVEVLEVIKQMFGSMVSQYASGFTRRFEPVNQIMAMKRGEDYESVDKKQGAQWVNDSTRYVDQIFEAITGMQPTELITDRPQEKTNALSNEPLPVPIGKITGYREILPSSTIEKLFNDIGRSKWKTEIRSKSPEAANTFNDFVRPQIEMLAEIVMYNGEWDGKSLEDKEKIVATILKVAKGNAMDSLELSIDPVERKTKLIFDVKKITTKKNLGKVLKYFDIKEEEMWKLDVNELLIVEDFLKSMKEDDAGLSKRLGIE
jgi:hypothetical protein